MKIRKAPIALGIAALVLVVCCVMYYRARMKNQTCTKQLFAMDTFMSFTATGTESEEAVNAVMQEIQRLDRLLSTGNPDSEVSTINANGGGSLSVDTREILSAAMNINAATGGLFDFTVYPLMELWGFASKEYHVPSDEEISALLPLVDASKVQLQNGKVLLGKGQMIDFGGIAKGYASSRAMDIFREKGITDGMVSLGGNVQTIGNNPDGNRWRIAVQEPGNERGVYLGVLDVSGKAVVTSGGYERYFEEDGQTYIHILDPRTGRPAESDLLSVTVVSADGTLADGLSTSLFIMGREQAVKFWRGSRQAYGMEFDMLLAADDGKIYVTEGLLDSFETEREIVAIRK